MTSWKFFTLRLLIISAIFNLHQCQNYISAFEEEDSQDGGLVTDDLNRIGEGQSQRPPTFTDHASNSLIRTTTSIIEKKSYMIVEKMESFSSSRSQNRRSLTVEAKTGKNDMKDPVDNGDDKVLKNDENQNATLDGDRGKVSFS